MIKTLSIALILIMCGLLSGCIETNEKNDETVDVKIDYDIETLNSRFGFMHPDSFYDMTEIGVFWQRPHPGPFIWGEIETSPGVYNWESCDKEVVRSQNYGVNIIATIWPFADWDQRNCHSKLSSDSLIFYELGNYRQKPCDFTAYKEFISRLVERYDGDGIDDMPELVVPIKYWEVSNEPSMQDDWLVFFVGTAQDYYEILIATYESIKNSDINSTIIQGGMAGVIDEHKEFWIDVFELGGSNYFDICNIHSINSDSKGINGPEFKQFLDEQEIDKPFWITEVELGSMSQDKQDYLETSMTDALIINFTLAFASGAEKIFHPGIMRKTKVYEPEKENVYFALETIVDKIDYFQNVEMINEGQYKFTVNDNFVYVLWGDGNIPEEIIGQIKKTDVFGKDTTLDSNDLVLTESPIFVEMI